MKTEIILIPNLGRTRPKTSFLPSIIAVGLLLILGSGLLYSNKRLIRSLETNYQQKLAEEIQKNLTLENRLTELNKRMLISTPIIISIPGSEVYDLMTEDAKELADFITARNVSFLSRFKNGKTGSGSGVDLGNGLIVTARHVVENTSITLVNFKKSEPWSIVSDDYDIALVKVPELEGSEPIEEYTQPLHIGQAVAVVGNPSLVKNQTLFGPITKIDEAKGVFEIRGGTVFGNSGGGVYSVDKKLIGVVSQLDYKRGINLCVMSKRFIPVAKANVSYMQNQARKLGLVNR